MNGISNDYLLHHVNFGEKIENKHNTASSSVSDLERTPTSDKFVKKSKKDTSEKHIIRNILLGAVSAIMLTYGSIVLHRKLTKPTFDEVQKCFSEIFNKDLSDCEVKQLIAKYKQICKNNHTEDFTKNLFEEVKKDYGLESVETRLHIEKLKDGRAKTAQERTRLGYARALSGRISVMPRTHRNRVIRSQQGEIFSTVFHELKHLRQYSEAYRADPKRFHEAYALRGKKAAVSCTKEELEEILESAREDLARLYGKLERYKEGSEEYKKGLEYIESWKDYPDDTLKNYEAYRSNLLEKEAYDVCDKAQKIYRYVSSIWKP